MSKTVLLVENDQKVNSLVKSTLEAQYAVVTASSSEDAIERLKAEKADIIITGLDPRTEGIGLARAVKSDPALRFIPVLMMAPESSLSRQLEWMEAGATCWIAKPFTPEQLVQAVRLLSF